MVESCPGGEFAVGTKVAALMGGLGRTINGSYAEYTRAPVTNVAAIESDLPWEDLAAIPESYATAWTCLFRNLEITPGQTLVIRGATSSFGQAALNMAVNAGVKVIATTRNRDRFPTLAALGASRAEVEGPDLSQRIAEAKQIDAVLDLVGNSTILDSLAMLRRGGLACLAGFLGGLGPVTDFDVGDRHVRAERRIELESNALLEAGWHRVSDRAGALGGLSSQRLTAAVSNFGGLGSFGRMA